MGLPDNKKTKCLSLPRVANRGAAMDGESLNAGDRSTGRSRGFGYVTFASSQDAKVCSSFVSVGRCMLIPLAEPGRDERQPAKKATRIFVARIPPSVSESDFRSVGSFLAYSFVVIFLLRDHKWKQHRGIGFITFATSDSVEDLMEDTHHLGGTTVAVDRATPKEDGIFVDFRELETKEQPLMIFATTLGGLAVFKTLTFQRTQREVDIEVSDSLPLLKMVLQIVYPGDLMKSVDKR
uniref:RRM domain-containing protein n=1 Tax=Brassica oleracea TaxID=3712 RepID=A0A3P6FLC1_BRAOL|nr:unnamed protein product [Brassica oleracea]